MLSEIKVYIIEKRSVSLLDLALHFEVDEAAMEKMLEVLEHKGLIAKQNVLTCDSRCGGCAKSGCSRSQWIIYSIK